VDSSSHAAGCFLSAPTQALSLHAQVFLCAAFLLTWKDRLAPLEFQDMVLLLQRLPTADWSELQLEGVLSAAHVLRERFGERVPA
jgi:hypothetical protein